MMFVKGDMPGLGECSSETLKMEPKYTKLCNKQIQIYRKPTEDKQKLIKGCLVS